MARALRSEIQDSAAEGPVTDALSLLKRDHRLVERLFNEFDDAIGQQVDPVARRICKMLSLHAQIEEEIFYPAARTVVGAKLIDEALAEHAAAKERIVRIEAMSSEHPEFDAAMEQLAREISVHIKEEESELFPQLVGATLDLEALGIALAERKETLMEVMGLHEDDELRATADPVSGGVAGHAAR